jgi:transcriptional regulator with XRE-family HTH domain
MRDADVYVNLRGQEIPLDSLDAQERKLLARLRRRARTHPGWTDFGNYWVREVATFYDARRVPRAQSRRSAVYQVAQDLCSRLGVAAGLVRAPDYRAELEGLIRERFRTRRAFAEATGLSEAMLSHVLAGRKDLSLESLAKALEHIGYRLRILPAAPAIRVPQARRKRGKRAVRSA